MLTNGEREMATAKKTKGFAVTCPYCHDADATLLIDLNNLEEIICSQCEATVSPRVARDLAATELARWERVVCWVETAATILADGESDQ
jgi:hypothetical protein